MIDEFIENFRQKHGFKRHTAMLPYIDEDDSDNEPIKLEGGRKMVIRRCIISPDEATTPEGDPDQLEDLGTRSRKRPAPEPEEREGGSMRPPPGKKPKKAKQVKTPKPKRDLKPKKPKKEKKGKKTSQTRDPGQTPQLGEPGETPPRGYPDGAPLMGEQNPPPGDTTQPTPPPRPGDTDPLEGGTPPLRPEGEPTPLGTDPGQIDVRAIPLPPRPALPPPPLRQPTPPPEPQPQPKPPTLPGRATPLPTPGCRTPPGGETDPSPNGNLKPRDVPLQADKEAETGMTAHPLAVMERTMVTERTMVMERKTVKKETVVMKGTVVMGTVQRAMAAGTAAKIEMATTMMRMKSPNAVAWEQAAHRQARRGMPPWRTKLLRQKNHR